jgi:hypothetical protein
MGIVASYHSCMMDLDPSIHASKLHLVTNLMIKTNEQNL